MLLRDQPHQFLFLSFSNRGRDADIHLIVFLGFLILIFRFFINDQESGELDR